MRRLLTAAVAVPLALLATFRLPNWAFFVFLLLIFVPCSIEYVKLLRAHAPGAPLWVVTLAVPPVAAAFFWALSRHSLPLPAGAWILAGALLGVVGVGTLLLLAGTPPAEAPAALGIVGFGIPYLALPVAVATVMQRLDPWLLFLLYAIVWLGDTAAYYVGSAWGRHKMAPRVSPNKSWEGAVAGFLTGIVATVVWSWWRMGEVRPSMIAVAAVTAVAAQLGDLFESLLKRGVNVKDSGNLVPGHGGFFDRMDAMLFAGPVMLGGLWLIAHEGWGMSLGIAVLGATGSVGSSVLRVVREHPDRLQVVALAAYGSDPGKLLRAIAEVRPQLVGVMDPAAAREVARQAPAGVEVVPGEEGLRAVATHAEARRVVAAMVGAAGLRPAWAAVAAGKDLALANKECLVVAGGLLTALAVERGVALLPVDSEHAALHQALRGGAHGEVARLVLTASGGPFWRRDAATFDSIEPQEALAHPTWKMGAKITVDSATMMNKGLELIEASHLFDVPPDRIEVVVHPRSLIHSLVEFCDGTWLAQLSANDMVFPVQYALSWPERWGNSFPRLSPGELGTLELHPLDETKFPTVALARAALAAGASAPAVLNGANEAAVAAFLAGRASFPAIAATIAAVLAEHSAREVGSLDDALSWDDWGRRRAAELLADGGSATGR